MDTKKLLVSICTIAIALFLVATVSACCECPECPSCEDAPDCECDICQVNTITTEDIADCTVIEIDGINILNNPSVIAGDTVSVKVTFVALVDARDVTIEVELDGDKDSAEAVSKSFDVEAGHTYAKTLSIEVPSELKDELSDDLELNVEISGEGEDGEDYESEYENLALRVQRESYNPVVKSVSTSQTVDAGETFPVDIVLKNMGYNELEDVYVTVSIPALGVEQTAYFGDLVSIEVCSDDDCDEDDTVSGRIYLEVPYTAEEGVYTLEVEITNDDVTSKVAKQIVIENDLSENVIVMTSGKTVAVGKDAEYSILLVNPTNNLKVYQIVAESTGDVSSSVDNAVVAVPAGSSKTVTVIASAEAEGEYEFDVSVLSGNDVVGKVTLSLNAEGASTNPIVVLTVVLAIIFLVLLVVLIVLISKKPQKTEEFGESYY